MKLPIFFVVGVLLVITGCKKELKTEVSETWPNGAKKKEISYYDRKTTPCRVVIYSPEGNVKSDQCMKNGMPDSITTIYHVNGKKYKEVSYCQIEGERKPLKHGIETCWYENGKLQSKGEYDKGTPIGNICSYFEDGTVSSQSTYSDGKQEGEEVVFYQNGKKKSLLHYSAGNRHGEHWKWREDSTPKLFEKYDAGELVETKSFHDNGKIMDHSFYKNGKLHGEKVTYNERGRKTASMKYEMGEEAGGKLY